MLTRNHRQESLTRAYVHAVAAQAGVIGGRPDIDYGIDLFLRAVAVREGRHSDTSVQVDLQLRSTTRAVLTDAGVAYDLDVDTYNDLREAGGSCPRFLVVLVLPADEGEWVSQSLAELTIRQCAYWISLEDFPTTQTVRSVRITLPRENVFSADAVRSMLARAAERNGR